MSERVATSGLCVLACGGRGFNDAVMVGEVLDLIHDDTPITTLIHGAASGADSHAGAWAKSRGIAVKEFPADWSLNGKAAGPIRNHQMLIVGKPDLVVAFPGGRGTDDMVRKARDVGVRVVEVSSD